MNSIQEPSVFIPASLAILVLCALFTIRNRQLGTLRNSLKQSALLIGGGGVLVGMGLVLALVEGLRSDHIMEILMFKESVTNSRAALATGYLAILMGVVIAIRALLKAQHAQDANGT